MAFGYNTEWKKETRRKNEQTHEIDAFAHSIESERNVEKINVFTLPSVFANSTVRMFDQYYNTYQMII